VAIFLSRLALLREIPALFLYSVKLDRIAGALCILRIRANQRPRPHLELPPDPMIDPQQRRQLLRGIILIVAASAVFAAVDGLSKILAEAQSVGQIVWARYALALPVLFAATPPSEWASLFRTRRPLMQVVRGLTPLTISVGMVLGVRYLPLADATVMLFAGPFILVALVPLLGERVHPSSWIGVGVGFLAVLIVARPGFSAFSHYAVFPLASAIFYAILQLITRSLGAAGEKPTTTLAWTLAVGCIASTPMAAVSWAPLTFNGWLLMIGLGFVFGISQLLMIRAFTYAPAGVLAPFNYVQVVAAVLFGVVVFGDVPDRWTLLGIAMIIGAGIYVVRRRAG
jgi:drug/metabolite transporter (DMT)-like permease